jgi:creatinine amidohydrolase
MIKALFVAIEALTGAVIMTGTMILLLPMVAASRDRVTGIEFEKMTWVEVKAALVAGKTTALIYTGGVEERGPQNVNGGHNLMAHATVDKIARRLGNAIYMPVLPFTPNEASSTFPGTVGITNELLEGLLARLAEQSIAMGFKNVILMGDHGGGQPRVYETVAKQLEDKYVSRGIHVRYCDQVYKANDDFNIYLAKHGYPASLHGGIPDTSEMMYLDKDNSWVRKDLVAEALGSAVIDGKPQNGPDGPKNGISGDARRSTPSLGKRLFKMKVDYAVRQIRGFLVDGSEQIH